MNKHLALIAIFGSLLMYQNELSAQFGFPKKKTPTNTSQNKTSTQATIESALGGLLGGSSSGMTQQKAAQGLQAALSQGANVASNQLGALDGFLANEAVKILFPPEARKIESTMRSLGMGNICDQFIQSVNHAAEKAVVTAKPIFSQAIQKMTIQDAISILTGADTSATSYLKKTSGLALNAAFQPIIKQELDKSNSTKYWNELTTRYNSLPLVTKVNPNLDQYVTQKASDGIFKVIAQEEIKIRTNPASRISSILQDVFGWGDKQKK